MNCFWRMMNYGHKIFDQDTAGGQGSGLSTTFGQQNFLTRMQPDDWILSPAEKRERQLVRREKDLGLLAVVFKSEGG